MDENTKIVLLALISAAAFVGALWVILWYASKPSEAMHFEPEPEPTFTYRYTTRTTSSDEEADDDFSDNEGHP